MDRPADPGLPGRGDSASLCAEIGEGLRAEADFISLGPPERPVRLPTEFKLAVSSSCCRLLRIEEVSCNVSEVDLTLGDAEA